MTPEQPYFPLRIQLPVPMVREIDMLIRSGHAPFDSRDAFIEEAVAQLLKEMAIGTEHRTLFVPAPEAFEFLTPQRSPSTAGPADEAPRLAHELGITPIDDPKMTALHPLPGGFALPVDGHKVADEPLFGLHNRDYPSLWALHRLGQLTSDGPMPFSTFRDLATQEAGRFALALWRLEERRRPGEPRLTALFPRGVSLRGTAGTYFAQAAIGSMHKDRRSGETRLHGPFFVWRVAALEGFGPKAGIAMTDLGYRLLEKLGGITIASPHGPWHARAFLEHLREHAPGDFAAFTVLLEGARDEAGRDELVERYADRFAWERKVPVTNLQGYVGRAREWGLITPGRGIYALTDFGRQMVQQLL